MTKKGEQSSPFYSAKVPTYRSELIFQPETDVTLANFGKRVVSKRLVRGCSAWNDCGQVEVGRLCIGVVEWVKKLSPENELVIWLTVQLDRTLHSESQVRSARSYDGVYSQVAN